MSVGDRSYLLTLAGLLRAGILADPVPAYDSLRPADMPVGWRRIWGRIGGC